MRARLAVVVCFLWCQSLRADAPRVDRVDRVAALIARGEQRVRAGDAASAIAYFRDAIGQAPRDPRGYRALASAYVQTDQPRRAVEVYEAALYACGERPELLLALAEAQDRCQRPDVALLILRTLAERSRELLRVHELRAQIAERTGRFAEALDARRALLALAMQAPNAQSQRDASLHVRALGYLAGEADRVNHGDCCGPDATAVRRALAEVP